MRSPGDSARSRRTSSFIRSSRLGRSSCAIIESDASSASTMSMPRERTTVRSSPHRGPATATPTSAPARPSRAMRQPGGRERVRRNEPRRRRPCCRAARAAPRRCAIRVAQHDDREQRQHDGEREQIRIVECHDRASWQRPPARGEQQLGDEQRAPRGRAASERAPCSARTSASAPARARAGRSPRRCAAAPRRRARGSSGRRSSWRCRLSSGSSMRTSRFS